MGRKWKLFIAVLMVGVLLVGVSQGGGYPGRRARAEERAPAASAAAAATTQKKLSRKQQQLARAQGLFIENCARCHGADGRGTTPMGKVFGAKNLTDAAWWKKERMSDKRLTDSIREGREQMPAFGKKLSGEEIAALVAFIKTFKGK
jgi:mono/diheme cytochrome c family protein